MWVGEYFVIILFVKRASDLINYDVLVFYSFGKAGAQRTAVLDWCRQNGAKQMDRTGAGSNHW